MRARTSKFLSNFFWLALIFFAPFSSWALNLCIICNQEIEGSIYSITDEATGRKSLICSNCLMLPRCYICGMPVKEKGVKLADGRQLCARDSQTVILDSAEAVRICQLVHSDLDRRFSRFAFFSTNVEIALIDRIDVRSLFRQDGYDFESPNLLGCVKAEKMNGKNLFQMRLMSGLPLAELKATCAHEYGHTWAGDNVPKLRRARIARDAEEGFCELVAYLLMDSQREEAQKKFILRNRYTRGQVDLFIAAEQRFGFDQVLDWMKFGNTARLEPEHLDKIRDITQPAASPVFHRRQISETNSANEQTNSSPAPAPPPPAIATFKLEGIFWGKKPLAIINGHSFAADEEGKVKFGRSNVVIRCTAITKFSVRIRELPSDAEQELHLP